MSAGRPPAGPATTPTISTKTDTTTKDVLP
jgi:hypothetical protein